MKKSFIACGSLLVATTALPAAIIANYDFTGNSLASSDDEMNSTAGDFSVGAGITNGLNIDSNAGQTAGDPGIRIQFNDVYPQGNGDKTLANSISGNKYYSFTITPGAGQSIELENLQIFASKTGGASFAYHLLSSVDGFTSAESIDDVTHPSTGTVNRTFDLSGEAPLTSATEFRFYIVPNNFTVGTNDLDFDDFVLNGSVVPEPSTAAILSLALLGLFTRRR